MEIALMNGHPKVTLIEAFDGTVIAVRPGFRHEFKKKDIKGAKEALDRVGLEVNIAILKGSPILRKMVE